MRATILLLLMVACGGGGDGATSGPLERTVHTSRTATRVHAVRHQLDLAALPIAAALGLPVSGTAQLDADLTIPIVDGDRDLRGAHGTLAAHCVGTCQIGDDATPLKLSDDASAFGGGDLAFSHLAFDQLDAAVTFADGHARLTRWQLASPDLEIRLDLDVTLAAQLGQSRVDACLRFRPTDALRARDPKLHTLLSLATPVVDPDGFFDIAVTGTIAATRRIARICGVTAPARP